MSRKTRAEYEEGLAVFRERSRRGGATCAETKFSPTDAAPYALVVFDRNCAFDDAAQVGAEMAILASVVRGYLTCHTSGGMMQWSVHLSRDIDDQDAVPVAVPAETTERMEMVS